MRPRAVLMLACCTFFMRFLAMATFFPYQTLWLTHAGHSTTTAAAILVLFRAVAFIAPPLIGGLADALRCHREVFLVTSVVHGTAVAALTLFPSSIPWQATCFALSSLTDSSSLVDAMVVRSLAWVGRSDLAPRSRAFGAVSWCAAGPGVGLLARTYGIATIFRIYPILILLNLPATAALPTKRAYAAQTPSDPPTKSAAAPDAPAAAPAAVEADAAPAPAAVTEASEPRRSFVRRALLVLNSTRTLLLLLLVVLTGVHFGVGFSYGFLFLESELQASGLQLGLSLTSQAIFEVPLFQVAAPLIRRIGMFTALLTCQLAAAVRFSGYVTMPSAWWVLPFELGHGYSFAISYTVNALLGEEHAASGLQATVLGMASSAQQIGALAATLGWSALIEAAGMRLAFTAATILFATAAVPLLCTPCASSDGCSCRRAHACCCRRRGTSSLLAKAARRSDEHGSELHATTSCRAASSSTRMPSEGNADQ